MGLRLDPVSSVVFLLFSPQEVRNRRACQDQGEHEAKPCANPGPGGAFLGEANRPSGQREQNEGEDEDDAHWGLSRSVSPAQRLSVGAGGGNRTPDIQLGKLTFYL